MIPINLVDRYTEEMRRSQKEVVEIMDKIRCTKLKEKGRSLVSNPSKFLRAFIGNPSNSCLPCSIFVVEFYQVIFSRVPFLREVERTGSVPSSPG